MKKRWCGKASTQKAYGYHCNPNGIVDGAFIGYPNGFEFSGGFFYDLERFSFMAFLLSHTHTNEEWHHCTQKMPTNCYSFFVASNKHPGTSRSGRDITNWNIHFECFVFVHNPKCANEQKRFRHQKKTITTDGWKGSRRGLEATSAKNWTKITKIEHLERNFLFMPSVGQTTTHYSLFSQALFALM